MRKYRGGDNIIPNNLNSFFDGMFQKILSQNSYENFQTEKLLAPTTFLLGLLKLGDLC